MAVVSPEVFEGLVAMTVQSLQEQHDKYFPRCGKCPLFGACTAYLRKHGDMKEDNHE